MKRRDFLTQTALAGVAGSVLGGGAPTFASAPPVLFLLAVAAGRCTRAHAVRLSILLMCPVALEEPLRLVDRAEDVPVVVQLHHGEVFLDIATRLGQHGFASGAADLSSDRHEDTEKAGPGLLDSSQLDDVIANSLIEPVVDVAGSIDVSWVVHQSCEVAEDCDAAVHADVQGHENSPPPRRRGIRRIAGPAVASP